MLSSRAHDALLEIRDNILLAQQFTVGFTLETFQADRRTFLRGVPLPGDRLGGNWRAIMGVGNVYRHEYDNVVEAVVWRTIEHSLAPLLAAVEHELAGR